MQIDRNEGKEGDLWNVFADRSLIEVNRVTGVPLAEALLEFDLHEVTGDGGEDHMTWLATNRVIELEYPVVTRATLARVRIWAPGEDA